MLNFLEKWEHLPKKLSGWLVIPRMRHQVRFLSQGNPEYILTHSNWAPLTAQPSSTNSTSDVLKSLVLRKVKVSIGQIVYPLLQGGGVIQHK